MERVAWLRVVAHLKAQRVFLDTKIQKFENYREAYGSVVVDANTSGNVAMGVDGGIIPVIGRSSRFGTGSVGGSVPESLIFESQLTARVVIDGRGLSSWTIDTVIQLRVRETLLRWMRKSHSIGRMGFFRFVNVEGAIVFNRRFKLRFGDRIDTPAIPGGARYQRLAPGTSRIQESGTGCQRVE